MRRAKAIEEAGADASYLCSTLLKNGPAQIKNLIDSAVEWLQEHEYESLDQLEGSMSQQHCPDPVEFERGNYMKMLSSYKRVARD